MTTLRELSHNTVYAETYLSAIKSKAPAHPGISRAQSDRRWPQGFKAPPPQGPPEAGRLMFPRAYRLPGHRVLPLVKSKHVFFSSLFILKINSGKNKQPLIGIIVPVKVSRLAVVRNRHKRLVREAIKPYLSKLKPKQELLFLAKPSILNQPLSVIQAEVLQLLQSCSLLN